MLCHVFSQWEEDLRAENTRILQPTAPLHRVFVCKTHVLPPPNSEDALRKKTSQPRIRAEIPDGGEDVEEVVHHQGLPYVPEII